MTWLGWTEENTAEVTRRWLKGESAAQIAVAMRIPTRNMVIGKTNRLGLQRDLPSKPRAARPPRPKAVAKARPTPKVTPFAGGWGVAGSRLDPTPATKLRTGPVSVSPKTLLELKPCHCRWPLDWAEDCAGSERMFCGSDATEGSSYCAPHHRLSRVHMTGKPEKYVDSTTRLAAYLDRRAARA